MFSAMKQGGLHMLGWGTDRHIAANAFDLLALNTEASGNWSKSKPPTLPRWPRPKPPKKREKPTVSSLFAKFKSAGAAVLD